MKRSERSGTAGGGDDEGLARTVLADFRQGWVSQWRTGRAQTGRRFLEACALQDCDRVAFRPPGPGPSDLLGRPREDEGGRAAAPPTDVTRSLPVPDETLRALALWTRYRLACQELLGGGRTGDA
jgi:hypothetical protein